MLNSKPEKKSWNINSFRQLGLLGFIIIICIIIQARNSEFLSVKNIFDLLCDDSILGVLAVGMMSVILTGGIDLSIGSTIALSGMITAISVARIPSLNPLVAVLIGCAVGFAAGVVNGFLIAKCNIPPFIATLGTMDIFRGLTYAISGGKWISAYQMPDSFKSIGTAKVCGISVLIIIAAVILAIAYYFFNYTRTGRKIYAVGSNRESARITGIDTVKIVWLVYIIMGVLAGLAGVLWVSKYASAQGDTASGEEMFAIAACVLGGICITGGSGKISGLILGTLFIGILNNALPMIHVSTFWQNFIEGMIILFAVLMGIYVKRQNEKAALKRRKI